MKHSACPGEFATFLLHIDWSNSLDDPTHTMPNSHRVGGNRKRNQQSTNADQKSIETLFSIDICRLTGDLRSSIVVAFSIAAYPVWN